MQLQWHKAAVSLFCRAALNSGEAILPSLLLQCVGVASLHTSMEDSEIELDLQSDDDIVLDPGLAILRSGITRERAFG